jgi:signal transduction histidine kinase
MSLSAFVTVVFLSGLIIAMIVTGVKILAVYQSDMACTSIQNEINSGRALKELGLNNIEEMEANTKTDQWASRFCKSSIQSEFIPNINDFNKLYIQIEINQTVVYNNDEGKLEKVPEFLKDTQAVKPILDSEDNEIGSVRVVVNPQIMGLAAFPVIIVIVLSIVALIVAKILSMFLTIPIINPINQLEKKVKAIAQGDQETASSTTLILKRPLREIESLADSTNEIMNKLHGYNLMLENQKEVLENQNAELEVQNDELIKSKEQIQKQQAQLIQSEKMASVGLLTAAITHEINTPIGAINSNAQIEDMLLEQLVNHSEVQTDQELSFMLTQLKEVNDINLTACQRITEIIKSLKSYSRLDQAEYQEADINEGIRSVLVLTNNLLKRRIQVHENYGDIGPVRCFPGQLNQVIMNIIVNASQAIEKEGEIDINTYKKDRDIYISIRDTGSGIKSEDIPRIFEPGFTTKGVGVGLGLGLYISYNIIQNHNGEITVMSEPGKGTEFIIRIPMDKDGPKIKDNNDNLRSEEN